MLATPCRLISLPVFLLLGLVSRGEVPPPSATPAKIVVGGPTSTAVDIKIVKVDQQIPKTYAGKQIHNTPGFQFYVSQHYALKSSRDETIRRMMLEVAELAYPHWVALVGAEPPDPDTRMYFVCAKSSDADDRSDEERRGHGHGRRLRRRHHHLQQPLRLQLPERNASLPPAPLVIHENLHMLQMVVYGIAGSEDFTYSGEQHVYDPAKKQLTVMCLDKAPINNWTDVGLAALRKDFTPMPKAADAFWNPAPARASSISNSSGAIPTAG